MSDLAAVACYGQPHRNSGAPTRLDLVGELLVGGSGLWVFHRLDFDGEPVRLRSHGDLATEVRAGFALSGLFEPANAAVGSLLGAGWAGAEVDVDPDVVRRLADLVADVHVGVVLTSLGVGGADDETQWKGTNWSVTVAAGTHRFGATRWG
ncbi:hypothetical protein [Blastococcus sp. TF02A-35]|uniref:hypothetical protein n=1 Tax=Blastococcus sp. TF02A-35 TaxID=2559612 RepID=UPI0010740EC7|nr:hypothetical protein [Blastococcus sp. TF02A_35]TFV44853.1 hypothetical protein E4P43_18310 [Blastococcus sp. TF02A_35]